MWWIVGALTAFLLVMSPVMGYLAQPWAPFWLKGANAVPPPVVVSSNEQTVDLDNLAPIVGMVSDSQRYRLARAAGWGTEDAIIATAISIAENGSGNPSALSGENFDKSRDLGLWQINSGWWPQFGGHAALIDPWRNVQAAYYIKGRQGWCAWSTYLASCGAGHTGSYAAFLGRARAASQVQPSPGEA